MNFWCTLLIYDKMFAKWRCQLSKSLNRDSNARLLGGVSAVWLAPHSGHFLLSCRYTISGARKTSDLKHSLNCGLSVSSLGSFVLSFRCVCFDFVAWICNYSVLVACIPNKVRNHDNINCK